MGVSTDPGLAPPAAMQTLVRWLPSWLQTAVALRRLALASIVANVVIVVTGGAVRLTGSGLGCPTWPRCTDDSLTPTSESSFHVIIEFANRQLTFVLVIVAVATWTVAMVRRTERRTATLAALGIPAQAVLGGLTVLTHLNPWLVAGHFMLSMAIIAITFALWWRVRGLREDGTAPVLAVDPRARLIAWFTVAATLGSLVVGTVVTGSGPHAGDLTDGRVRRTGLQPSSVSQLHADAVMVLIGLTVGLLVLVYVLRAAQDLRRAAVLLLVVVLAQGVIGYTQYFLALPELLVGVHMLGACLVWLAALNVVVRTEPAAVPARVEPLRRTG